jgi:hypothetical protein
MNIIKIQLPLIAAVLLAGLAQSQSAVLLGDYVDGATDYTAYPIPNLVSSPPITVSSLSQVGNPETGANVTRSEFGAGNPTPGGTEWLLWRTQSMADTPSSTDDYYRVTLEASPGGLNLSGVSFDMVLAKANTSNFTVSYSVFVSVDSGAFTSLGTGSMTHSGANNSFTTPVTQSINLSSIVGATTADIRIAWGDGGASSASQALFVQNIEVTAIPEPSTVAALFLGLGVMILLRRRMYFCNPNVD